MTTQITALGNEDKQSFDIFLDNGEFYNCLLEFFSENLTEDENSKIGYWYLTLTYNNIQICTQRRLVLSPNILETASNIIPYGIAIISEYKIEPTTKFCWENDLVEMLIVSYDEIKQLRGL
jgi:hypothetical protein